MRPRAAIPIFGPMVTISITAAAFEAIEATLPKGSKAEARPDGKGGYLVTLAHGRNHGPAVGATRRPFYLGALRA
jgi:hypothetical protein